MNVEDGSSGLRDNWVKAPREWSNNPAKRRRYSHEAYFQESWYQYQQICSSKTFILNKTFIVFKPDAAPVRCAETCLDILKERGIRPIHAQLFKFNRLLFRELWRYQQNISTYLRYVAGDALLCRAPSLFVLLEAEHERYADLASFLADFKGPSLEINRKEDHLRYLIGAKDGVLNHIHSPEDPLDVMREVGLLFDKPERRRILEHLARPSSDVIDTRIHIERFHASSEAHTLSLDAIKTRFIECLPNLDFEALVLEAAESVNFEKFLGNLRSIGLDASWWDAMTMFVANRPFTVPGVTPLLEYEEILGGKFSDE